MKNSQIQLAINNINECDQNNESILKEVKHTSSRDEAEELSSIADDETSE